jgi:hypothetical protein
MGSISWSVSLHKAGKACQGQTLRLTGLNHKLGRKYSEEEGFKRKYLILFEKKNS